MPAGFAETRATSSDEKTLRPDSFGKIPSGDVEEDVLKRRRPCDMPRRIDAAGGKRAQERAVVIVVEVLGGAVPFAPQDKGAEVAVDGNGVACRDLKHVARGKLHDQVLRRPCGEYPTLVHDR